MNKFDKTLDRSLTNERKWDKNLIEKTNPGINYSQLINCSIADLDFASPRPIVKSIIKRTNQLTFSYNYVTDETIDIIKKWYQNYHNFLFKNQKIKLVHGTVNSMFQIIQGLTKPQEAVLIQTPIYQPFANAIIETNRKLVANKLIWDYKKDTWVIDFVELEKQFSENQVKLFMFCNPHNPGCIAWDKKTISNIVNLCKKYNVILFSDEVHSDLKWDIFISCLSYDYNQIIVANSPNKAFNLGGIKTSYLIFNSDEIYNEIETQYKRQSITTPNVFAQPAILAAFGNKKCKIWLKKLLKYIQQNYDYVIKNLDSRVRIMKSNSSYLLLLNYEDLKISLTEIKKELLKQNLILNTSDNFFGADNWDILRINIGTSLKRVTKIVKRLNTIFQKY